jgi:hypothetical protein
MSDTINVHMMGGPEHGKIVTLSVKYGIPKCLHFPVFAGMQTPTTDTSAVKTSIMTIPIVGPYETEYFLDYNARTIHDNI